MADPKAGRKAPKAAFRNLKTRSGACINEN
ncbi:MAG: hypothetical protein ACI9S8_001552 [Chlamydiales bacterium]|jgi:hypothetical protein